MTAVTNQNQNEQCNQVKSSRPQVATPLVDISENTDCYTIVLDLPGFSDEEIEITFADDQLTVLATSESHVTQTKFLKREYAARNFSRTFNLDGCQVQGDKIAADYQSGVLEISLPKRDEAKPRRIKIN